MRLGFLTSLYIPDVGGAEIFLDRLVRTLQERGHDVVVVAPRRRGTHPQLAYPVVRILRPFSKRVGLHHVLPPLFVARRRYRFDLLHCQGEYRAAWPARTFKRLTGIPVVVRPVGGDFKTVQGHPRLEARLRDALQAADAVVAQGAALRAQIVDAGVAAERIVTIHNGVDARELHSDAPRPRPDPYLFFVGGLHTAKGWEILLRAFARITDQVAPTALVLAGRGDRHEAFERLRAELGLAPERVTFLGSLDRPTLATWYRHALAYVCPFERAPFSNATLEALTAGLPIVATAVDGNLEQIRADRDGLLVPPKDERALADAMARVCLDPALRERLSTAARLRAQDFTWDATIERYTQLYEQVLSETGPREQRSP